MMAHVQVLRDDAMRPAPGGRHAPGGGAPSVDRLHAAVVARLADAGVALPPATVAALAEAVMADALRLALDWIEEPAPVAW
jgi:hypothetical protein